MLFSDIWVWVSCSNVSVFLNNIGSLARTHESHHVFFCEGDEDEENPVKQLMLCP